MRRLWALLVLWAAPLLASVASDVEAMLGAQELRHATVGIVVVDCKSGELIYAHGSEDLPFGLGHIGPARADDLIDARHGFGPVGHCRDRLRSAYLVDLGYAAFASGR